jgi:hypothetical protein
MEGFSTLLKRREKLGCLVIIGICLALNFRAMASPIDFENQGATNPGVFGLNSPANSPLVMVVDGITVTFSGGALLSHVSDLPADETALYGTTSYIGAMSNPLRITFSAPVDDLVLSLYNGQTANTLYQATDNGIPQQLNLAPNLFGGDTQINFAGVGSEMDISDISGRGTWDFFIDNLQFDPAVPATVPDGGSTLWLLAISVITLGPVRIHTGQFRMATRTFC